MISQDKNSILAKGCCLFTVDVIYYKFDNFTQKIIDKGNTKIFLDKADTYCGRFSSP